MGFGTFISFLIGEFVEYMTKYFRDKKMTVFDKC